MKKGTETADGFIPHLEVRFHGGVLLAPVKLQTRRQRNFVGKGIVFKHTMTGNLPMPLRVGNALVFALPCGGEIVK